MSDIHAFERISAELNKLRLVMCDAFRKWGIRLTRQEVCDRLGVSRNTLVVYMKSRGFPQPMRDGKWLLAGVIEWEAAQYREHQAPADEAEPEVFEPDGRTHHLYRHFDAADVLLYVGVSFSALHRLAQHKENAHWFNRISRVEIQNYPSRAAVLAAERRAILTEGPAHNIMHNPRKVA